MEEDVTEAAPPFNIIEEDDADDDFELDLDAFVNIHIYTYICIYIFTCLCYVLLLVNSRVVFVSHFLGIVLVSFSAYCVLT